jgi:hypothetical protein
MASRGTSREAPQEPGSSLGGAWTAGNKPTPRRVPAAVLLLGALGVLVVASIGGYVAGTTLGTWLVVVCGNESRTSGADSRRTNLDSHVHTLG